ncbi:lamin Dm0-like [Phlebotomus argentipes]|uniref:lamin Dm0-like n=1 Tax=Phlebotomus argentipes TaxID=94469 RepID=UPI00289367C9|nr:lamin Dm0-like [Phlebotomus argentipes]XP_059610043.1 lamin Dm0-like [Phlebotomus argentipes]
MASKAKKSGSGTPLASSTPVPGGKTTPVPGPGVRPSSPLSPTRASRLHEKAELQGLNDRLAAYIERNRSLEQENSRLSIQVQTSQETVTREMTNMKAMYDNELTDARKLLDDTTREKAKLEIDTKRLWEENDDLKARLDKKTKDLLLAENSARMYESRCSELTGKYNAACSERKKYHDEVKELEKELDKLRKHLEEMRKHLEEETLARVDLENSIQSLREELTFKEGIHQQELQETRTRRQVDISEIDGRLSEQYEARLKESLMELREQYELQMKANRDQVDLLYEAKIKNLQNALNANTNSASAAFEELRQTRIHADSLKSRINELEGQNNTLNGRIHDLEKLLDTERLNHENIVRGLQAQLEREREEFSQQLKELQDLLDVKVSFDMEISAYDKLLSGEEHRLNISPSQSHPSGGSSFSLFRSGSRQTRRTPQRQGGPAMKRKRTYLEESDERSWNDFSVTASAKGDIEIVEADPEGKFVKLRNKGGREIAIGGWQLTRTVGANETVFKFHRSVKVDGDAVVTVWSADSGVTHEPPTNIVMKGQKWFVGDNMKTVLVNSDGEEVAASERVRSHVSSLASRHRESGFGGDDFYHHQSLRSASRASQFSSDGQQNQEKCRVM